MLLRAKNHQDDVRGTLNNGVCRNQPGGPNGSMDTTTTWKSARWSQWQHGHDNDLDCLNHSQQHDAQT